MGVGLYSNIRGENGRWQPGKPLFCGAKCLILDSHRSSAESEVTLWSGIEGGHREGQPLWCRKPGKVDPRSQEVSQAGGNLTPRTRNCTAGSIPPEKSRWTKGGAPPPGTRWGDSRALDRHPGKREVPGQPE
jgi:hypothetical protein